MKIQRIYCIIHLDHLCICERQRRRHTSRLKFKIIYQVCLQIIHGTGLGLYISKEIIQRHNGTIWGENNQDGKGATFALKIPVT